MSHFSQHNKAAHLRASSIIFACSLVSLMVIGGCSGSPSTSHLKDIIQSAQTELNNNKLDDAQDFSAQALAECKTWRMPLTDEQVALKNETLRLLEEAVQTREVSGSSRSQPIC